jgi:hypothetical protein
MEMTIMEITMPRKSLSVLTMLLALLSISILGACSAETPLPAPAGAAQALPTFIYFYTDN